MQYCRERPAASVVKRAEPRRLNRTSLRPNSEVTCRGAPGVGGSQRQAVSQLAGSIKGCYSAHCSGRIGLFL